MRRSRLAYQSGFIGIIIAIIAIVIIVVTVLAATGVIDLPRWGSGSTCEEIREACEKSCAGDSRCKNQCFIDFQACQLKQEGSGATHPR
jgi:hypothetical protein